MEDKQIQETLREPIAPRYEHLDIRVLLEDAAKEATHERTARNRARNKRIKAIKKILLFWK